MARARLLLALLPVIIQLVVVRCEAEGRGDVGLRDDVDVRRRIYPVLRRQPLHIRLIPCLLWLLLLL